MSDKNSYQNQQQNYEINLKKKTESPLQIFDQQDDSNELEDDYFDQMEENSSSNIIQFDDVNQIP